MKNIKLISILYCLRVRKEVMPEIVINMEINTGIVTTQK